jgi:hypothetical protein
VVLDQRRQVISVALGPTNLARVVLRKGQHHSTRSRVGHINPPQGRGLLDGSRECLP